MIVGIVRIKCLVSSKSSCMKAAKLLIVTVILLPLLSSFQPKNPISTDEISANVDFG